MQLSAIWPQHFSRVFSVSSFSLFLPWILQTSWRRWELLLYTVIKETEARTHIQHSLYTLLFCRRGVRTKIEQHYKNSPRHFFIRTRCSEFWLSTIYENSSFFLSRSSKLHNFMYKENYKSEHGNGANKIWAKLRYGIRTVRTVHQLDDN